jgi:hypothetical protein
VRETKERKEETYKIKKEGERRGEKGDKKE